MVEEKRPQLCERGLRTSLKAVSDETFEPFPVPNKLSKSNVSSLPSANCQVWSLFLLIFCDVLVLRTLDSWSMYRRQRTIDPQSLRP